MWYYESERRSVGRNNQVIAVNPVPLEILAIYRTIRNKYII